MYISDRALVIAKQATDYWMSVAGVDLDQGDYLFQIYNLGRILEMPVSGSDGFISVLCAKDNTVEMIKDRYEQNTNSDADANQFLGHDSIENAISVSSVKEEYEYLRTLLEGYSYKVVGVETEEVDKRTYDLLSVKDLTTEEIYIFFFDATAAFAHGNENLNEMLKERKEKDRKAVVSALESIGCKYAEDAWEESLILSEKAYDILQKKGELSTEMLQATLHIPYYVAEAIMYRFHFRGWLDEQGLRNG